MANLFSEKPIVEIVAVPGRDGTDIPIDDRLSDTSENPVQNKVVKQAIDNAVSATEDFATQAVEQAYEQLDEAKQDVLDDSGAGQNIKTINGQSILGTGDLEVGSQIDVDDALNPTSTNPVQNRTLYQAFNELNSDVIGEVSRLANRVYGYTHEAIVTDDLENDYNLIINGGYQRLYNPPIDWATEYASYYYLDDTIYRLNTSPTWDWDTEYYKKYTPNSDLANVSAVGMLAVLNHGVYTAVPTQPADWENNYDKYFYASGNGYLFNTDSTWNPNRSYFSYSGDAVRTQGNRLFINGDESDGYTFRGVNAENGIEFVKIWYFNENINIAETPHEILKAIIVEKKAVTVPPSIFDANEVVIDGALLVPRTASAKNVTYLTNFIPEIMASGTYPSIPLTIKKFTSNITELPINTCLARSNNTTYSTFPVTLTSVYLPELTKIKGNATTTTQFAGFYHQSSLTDIVFPKLETIENMVGEYGKRTFDGVQNVTLPPSVEYVGKWTFTANSYITLQCGNDDTEFHNDWFITGSAPTYPIGFEMASNWGCSINISKAAHSWDPERFTTIPAKRNPSDTHYLYNLLKQVDYSPTAHQITIPQDYVTDDLIDAYIEIGWDLLGA